MDIFQIKDTILTTAQEVNEWAKNIASEISKNGFL